MEAIKPDQQFWDIANTFINMANTHGDTVPAGKVGAALLYGAARFNAFVVAGTTTSEDELASRRDSAIAFLVDQYGKMLQEHFGDYQRNYAAYLVERDA